MSAHASVGCMWQIVLPPQRPLRSGHTNLSRTQRCCCAKAIRTRSGRGPADREPLCCAVRAEIVMCDTAVNPLEPNHSPQPFAVHKLRGQAPRPPQSFAFVSIFACMGCSVFTTGPRGQGCCRARAGVKVAVATFGRQEVVLEAMRTLFGQDQTFFGTHNVSTPKDFGVPEGYGAVGCQSNGTCDGEGCGVSTGRVGFLRHCAWEFDASILLHQPLRSGTCIRLPPSRPSPHSPFTRRRGCLDISHTYTPRRGCFAINICHFCSSNRWFHI